MHSQNGSAAPPIAGQHDDATGRETRATNPRAGRRVLRGRTTGRETRATKG